MSDNGNVQTLYTDEQKQNALYPRTVLSAVSGLNGQTLQENLDLKAPNTVVEPLINIWDEEWEIGSISSSGALYPSTTNIRSKNFIEFDANKTIYLKTNGKSMTIFFYNSSKALIDYYARTDTTITSPANTKYIKFYMNDAYGTSYNHDISINYPSAYTSYYPSKVSHIKSIEHKLTRNLLKPTLATSQVSGITVTNNGNGTYIISGQANEDIFLYVASNIGIVSNGKKIIGTTSADPYLYATDSTRLHSTGSVTSAEGGILENNTTTEYVILYLQNGHTYNNVVIKPMITDDLNATYNDFVSWEDSIAHNDLIEYLSEGEITVTTSTTLSNAGTITLKNTQRPKLLRASLIYNNSAPLQISLHRYGSNNEAYGNAQAITGTTTEELTVTALLKPSIYQVDVWAKSELNASNFIRYTVVYL